MNNVAVAGQDTVRSQVGGDSVSLDAGNRCSLEAVALSTVTTSPQFPPATGLILHGHTTTQPAATKVIYTSTNHTLAEVAGNLFAALHAMEEDSSVRQIYIETVPEAGLGVAIMDRLKKAAYRYQTNTNT